MVKEAMASPSLFLLAGTVVGYEEAALSVRCEELLFQIAQSFFRISVRINAIEEAMYVDG